jgi:hypothetical protein
VIAGRVDAKQATLEGEILVNGKEKGKNWKGISGYVLQDDVNPFKTNKKTKS